MAFNFQRHTLVWRKHLKRINEEEHGCINAKKEEITHEKIVSHHFEIII